MNTTPIGDPGEVQVAQDRLLAALAHVRCEIVERQRLLAKHLDLTDKLMGYASRLDPETRTTLDGEEFRDFRRYARALSGNLDRCVEHAEVMHAAYSRLVRR
jgi:hypothetical protein